MDNPAFSTEEFDINKKSNAATCILHSISTWEVYRFIEFIDSSEELLAKLLSKELAGFATWATTATNVKNLTHMRQFQLGNSNQENK